jgi:hypothetical protein
MVAHEISQPLCAILGNAEAAEQLLLSDTPPLAELRDIVVDIRDADLRADEAIRSIRALTQKREMQVGPLDLNALVTDILRLIAGDALYRRVHMMRELAADVPPVLGDRASVEQVLLNLLSNGMDAMRDTPETERQLTVQTRLKGADYAEVTVVDRGPGIAPEQMKHHQAARGGPGSFDRALHRADASGPDLGGQLRRRGRRVPFHPALRPMTGRLVPGESLGRRRSGADWQRIGYSRCASAFCCSYRKYSGNIIWRSSGLQLRVRRRYASSSPSDGARLRNGMTLS